MRLVQLGVGVPVAARVHERHQLGCCDSLPRQPDAHVHASAVGVRALNSTPGRESARRADLAQEHLRCSTAGSIHNRPIRPLGKRAVTPTLERERREFEPLT